MYNWATLLHSRDWHNTVNQLLYSVQFVNNSVNFSFMQLQTFVFGSYTLGDLGWSAPRWRGSVYPGYAFLMAKTQAP